MSLQDELNALKATFESSAPKDALEVMHRATDDLRSSGIMDRVLAEGEQIPDFSLKTAAGVLWHSKDALSKSPLILTFYRGKW